MTTAFETKVSKIALLAISMFVAGCAINTTPTPDLFTESFSGYDPAFHEGIRIEIKSGDAVYSGGGVWMGDGDILTAFHMLYNPPFILKESDTITIVYHGMRMLARPVYRGDLSGNYDLELLKIRSDQIPPRLAKLEVPPVCSSLEPVGAPVYVTAYDNTYKTFASPVFVSAYKNKVSSHGTTALVSHGVSGSPVFDYRMRCLAGVVSTANFGQVASSPKDDKCETDTLQMKDPHISSTCAISPGTEFTDAEAIRSFLKLAHKYEVENPVK